MEIKIRDRCRRRDREGSLSDPDYKVGSLVESSHQSDSRGSRERSNETVDKHHAENRRRHPSMALDAMSCLPFFDDIEHMEMPRCFN